MVQNKMLKQITLFAENKPGRLTSATKILSENGINIRAFTIADTGEFGIIRFVVDDADASLRHLRKAGFTVSETQVIGLEMPDKPGALFEISRALSDNEINIDYAYAYASATPDKAILILQASDLIRAVRLLTERGFHLVESSP
ncbi:MAG: ACT domain-containing protein [Halobacteriota archaeon]